MSEVEELRDLFRKNFNKYTRKAFQFLPAINKPRILDIGCGTGESTLEIARISDGEITAIDIAENSLKVFDKKIVENNLKHQIQTKKCSIHDMTFPNNSFDVIWMEGLQFINFDTRLDLSSPLLKSGGFLVLHDGVDNVESKIKSSSHHGFKLYSRFNLPDDSWWVDYYQPLEKLVMEKLINLKEDSKLKEGLNGIINEIKFAKTHPEKIKSLFLIFQKI